MTLYYRFRNCGSRTYTRERNKLLAIRPDAVAARKAAAAGDNLARLAYADIAEEEGMAGLAYFIRECMTCRRPKWMGKVPKAKRRKPR